MLTNKKLRYVFYLLILILPLYLFAGNLKLDKDISNEYSFNETKFPQSIILNNDYLGDYTSQIVSEIILNVSDNTNSSDLIFGTDLNGTDRYDEGIDEYAPPAPPSGSFDARLTMDGEDYLKDFRAPNTTIQWKVKFMASTGNAPIVLSWDPTILPVGEFILKDAYGGSIVNVDMKATNSYTDTDSAPDDLLIEFAESFSADFSANILNGTAPLLVQFNDKSSSDVTGWSWDLDGDGEEDSQEKNPLYTYENPGDYTVSLKVINSVAAEANIVKEDYIHVTPDFSGGDGPVILTLPLIEFPEDSESIVIGLDEYVFDPDTPAEDLFFMFSVSHSKGLGISYRFKESTREISFVGDPNWSGNASVIMWVNDGSSIANGTIIVSVNPVNDAPVILPIDGISFMEDTQSATYSLDERVLDIDTPLEFLDIQITGNDSINVVLLPGSFQLSAPENWNGQEILFLTVSDSQYTSVEEFLAVVVPVNDVPDPFILIYPSNSSSLDTNNVKFLWEETSDVDEADVIRYEIIVSTTSGEEILRENCFEAEYVLESIDAGSYVWRVEAYDMENARVSSEASQFTIMRVVGLDGQDPEEFALNQNYPNPFNPTTKIVYALSENSEVSLKIFDTRGAVVTELVNKYQQAGNYHLFLYPENYQMTNGVYFYQLHAGEFLEVRKMIYLK